MNVLHDKAVDASTFRFAIRRRRCCSEAVGLRSRGSSAASANSIAVYELGKAFRAMEPSDDSRASR
jgi:hypothetical protein